MNTLSIYQGLIKASSMFKQRGDKPAKAASNAEGEAIQLYKQENREVISAVALRLVRASIEQDRSLVMKLIHALGARLDTNAGKINAAFSLFAGAMSNGSFVWQSKIQHGITTVVRMGSGSKMKESAVEYKGFDAEKLIHYLLSLKKADWGKKATHPLVSEISKVLERALTTKHIQDLLFRQGKDKHVIEEKLSLFSDKPIKTKVLVKAIPFTPASIEKKYGVLTFKVIWKVLGTISFYSQLFDRHAIEGKRMSSENGNGVSSGFTTKKIQKMIADVERKESDEKAMAGDHYANEAWEEIRELEYQLEIWEHANMFWNEVEALVDEYNLIQQWVGPNDKGNIIQMPTGGSLEAYEEKLYKATFERLNEAVTEDTIHFMERATHNANIAEEALDKLLAS